MHFAHQAIEGKYLKSKNLNRGQEERFDHGHGKNGAVRYGLAYGSSWSQRRLPKPIETFDNPIAHVEAPFEPAALQLPIAVRLARHVEWIT